MASLIPLKSAVTKSGTGTWDLVHEDSGTPGRGTWGLRDVGLGDTGTPGRGTWDAGTRRRGDAGTRGRGDAGTRGRGNAGTRGRGTRGSRDVGHGDAGTWDAGLEIVETRGRGT